MLSFFSLSFFFILSFDYTRQWFLNSDINEIAQCDFPTIFLISKSLISGFIHITSFFMLSFDLLCYLFWLFKLGVSFICFHFFIFIDNSYVML